MRHAFSSSGPVIGLLTPTSQSGQDEQKGYMDLFAGAMAAPRNPKAHANLPIEADRAAHHLCVASLLMFQFDEANLLGLGPEQSVAGGLSIEPPTRDVKPAWEGHGGHPFLLGERATLNTQWGQHPASE
jgi:uncharacterized protein Ymh